MSEQITDCAKLATMDRPALFAERLVRIAINPQHVAEREKALGIARFYQAPNDQIRELLAEPTPIDEKIAALNAKVQARAKANEGPMKPKLEPEAATTIAANTQRSVIDAFNEKYMVVNEAGKAIVYAPRYDHLLKRQCFDRLSFEDLKKLYMNLRVKVKDKYKPAAEEWLKHRGRKQYLGGVVFDPAGRQQPDVLNLWHGFAVTPKPGDWSLMQAHIRDVVCSGITEHYDYLIGWMANMIQHPAQQGEVAVVMKGNEGCGKGTPARALLHIMGQHGMQIANAKHLVGNFNAHLQDCVLLFADEAFFAGDRQHIGVLKAIITERYLTIEGKFKNAVTSPNYLHLLMASNSEWIVPASLEARRFFVLNVPDTRRGDFGYFAAIWEQMEAGGYEAMLHDLLTYDLTGFNPRKAPETAGLQEQKKLSLKTEEGWWHDVLYRGSISAGCEWQEKANTDILFGDYIGWAKSQGERHPLTRETFGRFMVRMGCHPKRLGTKPQRHGYSLGSLDLARLAFTAATKLTAVEWPGGEVDEDEAPPAQLDRLLGARQFAG